MPRAPATYRPHGGNRQADRRLYDLERGSAASRLYGPVWRRAARMHLRAQRLCLYCALDHRVTAATLVDHLYPHRGDVVIFWLAPLWVSSCAECHSGMKQRVEGVGLPAIDALARRLGMPTLSEARRAHLGMRD